ncbi:MAG: hypothetical protein HY806_00445 [Nitrospirae bacterium]|nr:hypothetical protein [Nitrospirota bacterium]
MKAMLLSMIIVLMTATICAGFVRGPFSGKVIDAETKEPIEGAVVLVKWNKRVITGSPGGPATYIQEIKETLTNKEGEFYIEEYKGFTINPLAKIKNPEFLIYKPGYCVLPKTFFMPTCKEMKPKKNYYEAFVKGEVAELPRLKTKEERLRAMPSPFGEDSDYKKQKLFIRLLNEENENLGLKGEYKIEDGN